MLTIQTWGGLGDVLRELSWVPHGAIWRASGRPSIVKHLQPDRARVLRDALPPSAGVVEDLAGRCSSLRWGGEGPVGRREKGVARGVRELVRLAGGGRARLFPFEIALNDAERARVARDGPGLRVVVQTHLVGMATKRWPVASWRQVLEGIARAFPGARLEVLEPSPEGASFGEVPGCRVHAELNAAEAVALVRGSDALLSVDSWAKYVAAWGAIPQVVIVPDQRPDYPHLDPESVWRHSFYGVAGRPEVRLVGLERRRAGAVFALSRMADLGVEAVLEAFVPWVRARLPEGRGRGGVAR